MLKKTTSNPLTLRVGEDFFAFNSPKELEFALSGRTGLPAAKVMELMDATDSTLVEESRAMRRTEERICSVIANAEHDDQDTAQLFEAQQLCDVYWDNGWRAIMNALSGLDAAADPYRRVGLEKYLQFLVNRREVVQKIYASRHPDFPDAGEEPMARALVDLTTHLPEPSYELQFERLPKGEPIEIQFAENQTLTLLLAKHKFNIVRADDFRFVDDSGSEARLGEGKNIVGRDETSDIIVDEEYRDVSRKHLIVETEQTGLVRLTDISSMGTCVPCEYLS